MSEYLDTDGLPIGPATFTETGSPEAIAKLYTALGKAQAAFPPIPRSKTVKLPTYTYAYAPLEDLLALTRPALTTNGITVITPVVRQDGTSAASVLVIVAHEAGARLVFSYAFTPQADMKQAAGQWTYLRRYGYSAALNLAADDDADDHETQTEAQRPIQRAPKAQPAPEPKAAEPEPEKAPSLFYQRYETLRDQCKAVLPEDVLAALPLGLAPTANQNDIVAAGKRLRETLENTKVGAK